MRHLLSLILLMCISITSFSQRKVLNVGIYSCPPFVIYSSDNGELTYDGLSVELWDMISEDLGIEYKFINLEYMATGEALNLIEKDSLDVVVGSVTINSDRLDKINFTLPFYNTELAIVSKNEEKSTAMSMLSNIFSLQVLKFLSLLILLLLVMGIIFWSVERKHNEQFRDGPKGIFDGFWYAAIVQTTVGFGDKVTVSKSGRIVSLLWMYISLGITGIFIGGISSQLTIERLEVKFDNIAELKNVKTGSILNTTSAKFLEKNGIKFISYNDVNEAVAAIAANELDAFVYDTPIIRYELRESNNEFNMTITPIEIESQSYGLVFDYDYDIKDVNSSLFESISGDNWKNLLFKYNLN